MKLEVKMFARARDLAGAEAVEIDLPEKARVSDLRTALGEAMPQLLPLLPSLHVAMGTDYATDDTLIDSTQEIACFPPVSGG
ncbi:MAG: MoaD/ThiS family protein [Planctomycetaceae bacterium]|jgi:sulfur-carrier protein|nr:MoaD/ThiS family protein [Planctomycetaceae bacterium]MBT6157059.1 MoaD/ThiS family protein [Planctomycetaceae bacterium]MBT6484375.1 MoaD/ThiS family protein [Planctomycetaceae bacterium]MBT6497699.1 MoaD/ThiS family protein [Planctomycetaceae bacterium]